jgi:hypothetical protein
MKKTLILVFISILLVMTLVTVNATLDRSLLAAGNLLPDPWFQATLCDAYCGFLTFYCWVAYKETTWLSRLGWFVAIMLLGNFAMATYALCQLWRLPPGAPASQMLIRAAG